MAIRTGWGIVFTALYAALIVWVWALVGVTFALRWGSVERPGLPLRRLFPYGEMRVGVDATYPPFAAVSGGELFGLDIEVARTLAARMDVPLRFVTMGYDGLYDALRTDQVDMLISGVQYEFVRSEEVSYTLPYYNAGLVLVSAAGYADMTAVSGLRLAFEFGSDADLTAQMWLRRIAPFQTMRYELPSYALDATRLGQADAALVDATTARLYLREQDGWAADFVAVTDVLYTIALRRDRGQTWAVVNQALAGILEDGTVARLIDVWVKDY